MRVFGESDRMNVTLDTEKREVLVVQKWRFDWTKKLCYKMALYSLPDWTFEAKAQFTREAFDRIYQLWSNKAYVTVRGNVPFVQAYAGVPFTIRVQVQEVTSGEHWKVKVQKVPLAIDVIPYVLWYKKEIFLTSNSLRSEPMTIYDRDHKNIGLTKQYSVSHEFGHAFGNTTKSAPTLSGDEYKAGHPDFDDFESIMNIGNEVRRRHYTHVKGLLEQMIPGAVFDLDLV